MWAGGAGPKLTQISLCFDKGQVQNGWGETGVGDAALLATPMAGGNPVPSLGADMETQRCAHHLCR